jgi:hypothetical protein
MAEKKKVGKMAPKAVATARAAKKASTSYSPTPMSNAKQYDTRRNAEKKQAATVQAKKLNATKYAPTPMSEDAKKAAAKRGLKKQAVSSIKKDVKKIAGLAGKVAGGVAKRAKATAREARDIPTAVGTAVAARGMGYGAGKFAKKDVKTQIKEVGSAIKSGKKGTSAAEVRPGARKKGTVGTGSLDYNVSKTKRK